MAVLFEVPALSLVAVAVLLVLMAYGYKYTLGALLVALVTPLAAIRITGVHPFGFLRTGVDAINNAVLGSIGAGIEATEWAFHKVMNAQTYAWQEVSATIADVAEATLDALGVLRRVTLPALIAAAVDPLGLAIRQLERQVAALARAGAHVAQVPARVIVHRITEVETRVVRVSKTVAVAVPSSVARAVAVVLPRLGALERDAAAAKHRLARITRTLTPAGIVGLVGAALATLGLGWARCSNVHRLGKRACGMDNALLESLIADSLLILGTVSLVKAAKDLQALVGEAAPEIRRFWRV